MRNPILILFLLLIFYSTGQSRVTDSLLVSLRNSENEERVDILCDLCWEFRFLNSDTAAMFGKRALNLAEDLNYNKGKAQSLNDLGIIYLDKGDYNKALEFFNNSLSIRIQLKDSSGIASLYNKIGIVYQKKGHLKESLENALKALDIYEELNEVLWVSYCLNNIAIINYNLGNFNTSLEYHAQALELRRSRNDKYGMAGSYSNIANVYLELGDTLEAIQNYTLALGLSRELNSKESLSVILTNLGSVYLYRKDYKNALGYLDESLQLRESLGDKKAISSSSIKIGHVYTNTENYTDAQRFLYRGLSLAYEVGIIEEERQAYSELSNLYSIMGILDSSYKYLNLYTLLTDSVYDKRLEQQIIDTQAKYDSERKDKDLEILKNKNELNEISLKQRKTEIFLLIFIIISLTGAGIFFFYRRKQQQQHALDIARIKYNEQQIEAVLEGQEEERRKIARELHDGVGQSLSGVKLKWESVIDSLKDPSIKASISNIAGLLDTAASEIRTISHQMLPKELEQFGLISAMKGIVKFANENSSIAFSFYSHNIENRLPENIELGVFRITQELVSNIHKHSKATEVSIQLLKRNSYLILIMEDNGVGFDYNAIKNKGIGLMNIQSRVNGMSGVLNYETSPGNGTIITVRIPI